MNNALHENILRTKIASKKISLLPHEKRNAIILSIGEALSINQDVIISANARDIASLALKDGSLYDRLILHPERIDTLAESCKAISETPDPLNHFIYETPLVTPQGITIRKQAVPLGVVACIYEARPGVTVDIAAMAIKSGNAVILRGGKEAHETNTLLISLMKDVLHKEGVPEDAIFHFPSGREFLTDLYQAVGLVDVIIPRGGKELIQTVRRESLIPVIETGAGVVHLFVDEDIHDENMEKAVHVVVNAKVSRPSVCNALDTLIIHRRVHPKFSPLLFSALLPYKVRIGIRSEDRGKIEGSYPEELIYTIHDEDFHTEQLSLSMNVVFVDTLEAALEHIDRYSSHHSDGILSESHEAVEKFTQSVDSAVVYTNTSPRFSDGGCFGFGGEVGISTQKLHARGPMGAEALTSYKYGVTSDWKTR